MANFDDPVVVREWEEDGKRFRIDAKFDGDLLELRLLRSDPIENWGILDSDSYVIGAAGEQLAESYEQGEQRLLAYLATRQEAEEAQRRDLAAKRQTTALKGALVEQFIANKVAQAESQKGGE